MTRVESGIPLIAGCGTQGGVVRDARGQLDGHAGQVPATTRLQLLALCIATGQQVDGVKETENVCTSVVGLSERNCAHTCTAQSGCWRQSATNACHSAAASGAMTRKPAGCRTVVAGATGVETVTVVAVVKTVALGAVVTRVVLTTARELGRLYTLAATDAAAVPPSTTLVEVGSILEVVTATTWLEWRTSVVRRGRVMPRGCRLGGGSSVAGAATAEGSSKSAIEDGMESSAGESVPAAGRLPETGNRGPRFKRLLVSLLTAVCGGVKDRLLTAIERSSNVTCLVTGDSLFRLVCRLNAAGTTGESTCV